MRYTNEQIAKAFKYIMYIIENVEMLNNALDDALRVKEIEQQNKRYLEALKNIYDLAENDEHDNTLEQIVLEVEKALEGDE